MFEFINNVFEVTQQLAILNNSKSISHDDEK